MTVQQEAYHLIDQLPEDGVNAIIQIMVRMIKPAPGKETSRVGNGIKLGVAKGKFQLNDEAFDAADQEIAGLLSID